VENTGKEFVRKELVLTGVLHATHGYIRNVAALTLTLQFAQQK